MVGILNGIMTILAMLTFFGIVWWAFSARRKKDNEEASQLPFNLPDERPVDKKEEGSHE